MGSNNPQPKTPSRQQRRQALRLHAMGAINERAGGEPRKIRRAMARTMGNRLYTEHMERDLQQSAATGQVPISDET